MLTCSEPRSALSIPNCSFHEFVRMFNKFIDCLLQWLRCFVVLCLQFVDQTQQIFGEVLNCGQRRAVIQRRVGAQEYWWHVSIDIETGETEKSYQSSWESWELQMRDMQLRGSSNGLPN